MVNVHSFSQALKDNRNQPSEEATGCTGGRSKIIGNSEGQRGTKKGLGKWFETVGQGIFPPSLLGSLAELIIKLTQDRRKGLVSYEREPIEM